MERKDTKKLEVRMTASQIDKLDSLAAKANMDRSQYVRTVCLQSDRLFVFSDYTKIVQVLSEIDGKLSSAIVSGYLMRMDSHLDEMNKEASA